MFYVIGTTCLLSASSSGPWTPRCLTETRQPAWCPLCSRSTPRRPRTRSTRTRRRPTGTPPRSTRSSSLRRAWTWGRPWSCWKNPGRYLIQNYRIKTGTCGNMPNKLDIKHVFYREGDVIFLFKRPRLTAQNIQQPAAKKARVESSSSETGTWRPKSTFTKYSCNPQDLIFNPLVKNFELLNAAYTQSTGKVHASALSLFRKFENTYRIKFEWPLNEETINKFCHWALKEKELKSKTVEAYISSIATIHKLNLLDDAACKNFICKTILRGAENMEIYKSSKSRLRLVMTLDTLKI